MFGGYKRKSLLGGSRTNLEQPPQGGVSVLHIVLSGYLGEFHEFYLECFKGLLSHTKEG